MTWGNFQYNVCNMFSYFIYYENKLSQWVRVKYIFKEKWNNDMSSPFHYIKTFTNKLLLSTEYMHWLYVQKHLTRDYCFWETSAPDRKIISKTTWLWDSEYKVPTSLRIVPVREGSEHGRWSCEPCFCGEGEPCTWSWREWESRQMKRSGRKGGPDMGGCHYTACATLSSRHSHFSQVGFVCFWIQCSSQ